ncbi:MAG: ATP-binding protein [Acidimicrobiales bacterium]
MAWSSEEAEASAVELEIPAQPEFVSLVRLVVSSLADFGAKLDEERVDDLKIAVSEACTNAIEAHGAVQTDERVLVRCRVEPGVLEVRIEDRGRGFDPEALLSHPPVTDPERLKFERGLGIPLIRTLVDDVEFVSSSEGTAVRIVVRSS